MTAATQGEEARGSGARSALAVLVFVLAYWRAVPLRFAGMLLGVAAGVAIEVQIPAASAALVVSIERHLAGGLPADAALEAGLWLCAVFAAVFTVKQLYLRNWMYLASQVMQRLVADGFHHVQRFSHDWHVSHFAGSTQRKVTRGMWAYDVLADSLVIDLGPALSLLVGFTVTMGLRDPILGAYFGASILIFVAVSIVLSFSYVAPANELANEADTAVGGALADAITCNTVVRSFGAEAREEARFAEASQHWRVTARRAWSRSMDAGAVQSLLLLLLLGGMVWLVLHLPGTAGARVEHAVYVVTTYLVVHSYLRNIGWQVRRAQQAINELEDLVEISKLTPEVDDRPDAPELSVTAGEIRFEGVEFAYRNQPTPLFSGLDVRIEPGERVALVGESGAGKTSFVKLLQRLYDIQGGRITIDGQDVAAVTQRSLRQAISLVPQEPILFHRSLAENIAYARPDATQEEIEGAARQAHAHAFIARLEHGYDTLVGERGIKLSGGERQRVAIARAILADAPILVLDEATSSLDSVTEQLIQDALATLMAGRTAVIIAHRLSTVRRVDRILVFDAGRILEQGTHAELIARPGGHYRRLVEMQTFQTDVAAE